MVKEAEKYLQLMDRQYYKSYGKVVKVVGLTIESVGPKARMGDLCKIYPNEMEEEYVIAEVVGFQDSRLILMPVDSVEGVGTGCIVENTGHPLSVLVGEELLGHTLDGIGRMTDGTEEIHGSYYPLENTPPDPMDRRIISEVLPLGVKAVDGLITVGKGQRIGVFAGSGVGKSTLLGMFARNTKADINVIALIDESGCMIAAPSANTSGKPSPTEAGHVALDLDGKIPMILDGGPVGIGIESTIIDLTEKVPMILRPGYITKEMLEEVLGEEVRIDPGIIASDSTKKPKAPGMKYKHYAPKADLVLVEGEQEAVVAEINALVREKQAAGLKVGVVATDETESLYQADYVVTIGARSDEDAIARHLYKILREFDDWNVDAIYSESFSTPRIGQAIMNRLMKAAGHQGIHV